MDETGAGTGWIADREYWSFLWVTAENLNPRERNVRQGASISINIIQRFGGSPVTHAPRAPSTFHTHTAGIGTWSLSRRGPKGGGMVPTWMLVLRSARNLCWEWHNSGRVVPNMG